MIPSFVWLLPVFFFYFSGLVVQLHLTWIACVVCMCVCVCLPACRSVGSILGILSTVLCFPDVFPDVVIFFTFTFLAFFKIYIFLTSFTFLKQSSAKTHVRD